MRRRTILVADDSSTIQRLVAQTFADGNYDIVSVSNGDAAIRKLDEVRPQVVLADIYMPGKNGYEVCAHIKNHAAHSKIPVILLVGAFDAFDENTAKQAGAVANITKPFEPQSLIDLVASLLPKADEDDSEDTPRAEKILPLDMPASADLLGLEDLFPAENPDARAAAGAVSEEAIERIADRVIQKLTTQVIESIAWDVVPDITEKILREELKKK